MPHFANSSLDQAFHPLAPVTADHTTIHVQRAIRGDSNSAGWLVSHFHPFVEAQVRLRLRGRGSSHDVEDLVEDVWLVTLQRLSDLEPRDGRHAPVLVKFLGTTALGMCNNFLRRKARQMLAGEGQSEESTGGTPANQQFVAETRGVLTRAVQDDLHAAIARCLQGMAPEKRDVLVLRLMEQRSNTEIAGILGVPANTIAVRYRRALQELRDRLPAEVYDELRGAAH